MNADALVEFLLARYDEAEERVAGWLPGTSGVDEPDGYAVSNRMETVAVSVVADCAAKRRIVAKARVWLDGTVGGDGTFSERMARQMCADGLRCLAEPFADHPEFDPDWRL